MVYAIISLVFFLPKLSMMAKSRFEKFTIKKLMRACPYWRMLRTSACPSRRIPRSKRKDSAVFSQKAQKPAKMGLTYIQHSDILKQTVEAEITLIVHPQRTRAAENRAKRRSSNGPPRAQSKASAEYSATCGHTSVAGGMLVPR